DIVTSVKGKSLRIATVYRHPIDMWAAAAIAGKYQRSAIWRIDRFGVDQGRAHHASQARSIRIDGVDLRDAITREHDGQALAIWRPCWCTIVALVVRQGHALTGSQRLYIHHRLAGFEAHV